MKQKLVKYGLVSLATIAIVSSQVVWESSSVSAATQTKVSKPQMIKLASNSQLVLRDAQIMMQNSGKVLTFTVSITNNSTEEMDLTDYNIRVKSVSGKKFKASLIDADKTKTNIIAKSSVNLTYYAQVDAQTTINDILIDVVKWDFNMPDYERALGTIKAAAQVVDKVDYYKDKVMLLPNTKIRSAIKQTTVTKDNSFSYITMNVLVENVGYQSTDLSKLSFIVQTPSLSVYDVDSGDLSQIKLQPGESKTITLQSKVPIAVASKALSLVAYTMDDSSKTKLPLGVFAIPLVQQTKSTGVPPFQAKVMQYPNTKIRSAIKQFSVDQDKDYTYISMSYLVENSGYTTTDLSKLKFQVQTPSLSIFDVSAGELSQITVQPRERKLITLQAKVPNTVASKALSLVAYTVDDATKSKLPLGVFALPMINNSTPVAIDKTKNILVNGQTVSTTLKKALVSSNGSTNGVSMDLVLENIGENIIDLPALDINLQTASGQLYALSYSQDASKGLAPKTEKTITLSGNIPASVNLSTSKLVLRTAGTEQGKGFLLNTFSISEGNSTGDTSSVYTADNYTVKVNSITRTPADTKDVLSGQIVITNTSGSYIDIPNLTGNFVVNGIKIDQINKVSLDQNINIAPNESYSLYFYSDIPYTTGINSVGFMLDEQVNAQTVNHLYKFSSNKLTIIPQYTVKDKYEVKNVGIKSSSRIVRAGMYANNMFYGQVELTNNETRSAVPQDFGGLIENSNGQVLPVAFSTYKERLLPGGKVLLSFWTAIPDNFDQKNITFIMGQSIPADSSTTKDAGGSTTAPVEKVLLNTVAYTLPVNEMSATQANFDKLPFANYQVSLRNIYANLNATFNMQVNGVYLNIRYDLNKIGDLDEPVAEEHKFILEIVNQDANKAYVTKELEFDKLPGYNTFKEGSNFAKSLVFEDSDITEKILTYGRYVLNIYDQFGDSKILIGSKELTWFATE